MKNLILLLLLTTVSLFSYNYKPKMVNIDSGSFIMGNKEKDAYYDEIFEHKVFLSSFKIAETEITNEQFSDVMNVASRTNQILKQKKYILNGYGSLKELIAVYDRDSKIIYDDSLKVFSVKKGFEEFPVCEITWFGAAFYCNILSEIEGLDPVYDLTDWSSIDKANGYRLPSEAEWEYTFFYKDIKRKLTAQDADSLAWYMNNSDRKGKPIKTKFANKGGIYDMPGNISEWCNDNYGDKYYHNSPKRNPRGEKNGEIKSVRGGNWYLYIEDIQGYRRNCYAPEMTLEGLGFRIAKGKKKKRKL